MLVPVSYFRTYIYLCSVVIYYYLFVNRKNKNKEVFFLGLEFVHTIEKIVESRINNKLEYYKNVVLLTYKKKYLVIVSIFLSFFESVKIRVLARGQK